jgi:hypothetical protein
VLLLDEQNSDNGMALKLIKDLYGSSLERGFVQLGNVPAHGHRHMAARMQTASLASPSPI